MGAAVTRGRRDCCKARRWHRRDDAGGQRGDAQHRAAGHRGELQEYLTKLAEASGIETPTREDLARLDRRRKKKGSNNDWTHPHDPDAKITKMKDGRTHWRTRPSTPSISRPERSSVTVQDADDGDTTT